MSLLALCGHSWKRGSCQPWKRGRSFQGLAPRTWLAQGMPVMEEAAQLLQPGFTGPVHPSRGRL